MPLALRPREHGAIARTLGGRAAHQLRHAPVFLRRLRDHSMEGHAAEVVQLALEVGHRLGLSAQALFELELAARLHRDRQACDPAPILDKPAPLSKGECSLLRRHPEWGASMLAEVPGLEGVAKAVHAHHERWDGTGYPRGLAGEAIPFTSRIVAVCDAFSAMTTERPYRAARPAVEALAELRRCAGSQFDPAIVEAFALHADTPALA